MKRRQAVWLAIVSSFVFCMAFANFACGVRRVIEGDALMAFIDGIVGTVLLLYGVNMLCNEWRKADKED